MEIIQIILIGITLAIDAFAVTVANCTTYKHCLSKQKEWSMPIAFALFQFLMPVIGYFVGSLFIDYLGKFSGFLSAGIFLVLSLKIIIEKVKEIIENEKIVEVTVCDRSKLFTLPVLLLQGVATSIDALAIGVTFAVSLSMNIFVASAIIGITTFILVSIALLIGKILGKAIGKYADFVGAGILFILFIKCLIEAIISL